MMKKPWWLRLIGWVALISAFLLGASVAISPAFFMGPRMLPILVAWAAVTVGLFMAWVLIVGMIWVATRSVRTQAALTFEVLADSFKIVQPEMAPAAPRRSLWDNPATGIICNGCKRPHAMLYCKNHKKLLCFPCAGKHDSEDCLYIAADRHAPNSQEHVSGTKDMGRVLGL
jgi:hypothetical protein